MAWWHVYFSQKIDPIPIFLPRVSHKNNIYGCQMVLLDFIGLEFSLSIPTLIPIRSPTFHYAKIPFSAKNRNWKFKWKFEWKLKMSGTTLVLGLNWLDYSAFVGTILTWTTLYSGLHSPGLHCPGLHCPELFTLVVGLNWLDYIFSDYIGRTKSVRLHCLHTAKIGVCCTFT